MVVRLISLVTLVLETIPAVVFVVEKPADRHTISREKQTAGWGLREIQRIGNIFPLIKGNENWFRDYNPNLTIFVFRW